MDSTNLTNKIISIVISLVVATCVLIPICSSLTPSGNDGGTDGRSTGNDLILTDMMDIRARDNSYNSIFFEDKEDHTVTYFPGHDGFTYQEGEIVALLSISLSGDEDYIDPTFEIFYHNGKFHIVSSDQSMLATGDYVAFTLHYSEYRGEVYFWVYSDPNNVGNEDLPFVTSYAMGVVKYAGPYTDSNWIVYATNNPNVSIPVDNLFSKLTAMPEIQQEDFLRCAIFQYAFYTPGYSHFNPCEIVPLNEDNTEIGFCPKILVESFDDETYHRYLSKFAEPITLHQWDGVQYENDFGNIKEFYTPQYLIFNKHFDYTTSGNGNNGSADNGTIGTLISMIPIFVILGILSALVIPIMRKENTI